MNTMLFRYFGYPYFIPSRSILICIRTVERRREADIADSVFRKYIVFFSEIWTLSIFALIIFIIIYYKVKMSD